MEHLLYTKHYYEHLIFVSHLILPAMLYYYYFPSFYRQENGSSDKQESSNLKLLYVR
jgi:hypothetical protein